MTERAYRMEDLQRKSTAPLLEQLIAVADAKDTVFYSQLADLLSYKVVPGHVADQQVGPLVGTLMDMVWEKYPSAPPINMLVVSKAKGVASHGSDNYLKNYFHLSRLPRSDHGRLELAEQATLDVWSYREWPRIYRELFDVDPAHTNSLGIAQFDDDGQGDNPRYHGGPESPEHKRLKRHVLENLARFGIRGVVEAKEEHRLLSGDELDVFAVTGRSRIAIEVKSIRSGDADLVRGIYQCVKYRAVLEAQFAHLREAPAVNSFLVTERPLPPEIQKIAKRLAVRTFVEAVNNT